MDLKKVTGKEEMLEVREHLFVTVLLCSRLAQTFVTGTNSG